MKQKENGQNRNYEQAVLKDKALRHTLLTYIVLLSMAALTLAIYFI